MNVTHNTQGNIELVHLAGNLDMANADDTRRRLKSLVEGGAANLVLDLGGVSFVDSSGLSVLVSTLKAVREKQGEVVLAAVTPTVLSLIELTRLHQVFKIFDSVETALKHFSEPV